MEIMKDARVKKKKKAKWCHRLEQHIKMLSRDVRTVNKICYHCTILDRLGNRKTECVLGQTLNLGLTRCSL